MRSHSEGSVATLLTRSCAGHKNAGALGTKNDRMVMAGLQRAAKPTVDAYFLRHREGQECSRARRARLSRVTTLLIRRNAKMGMHRLRVS